MLKIIKNFCFLTASLSQGLVMSVKVSSLMRSYLPLSHSGMAENVGDKI